MTTAIEKSWQNYSPETGEVTGSTVVLNFSGTDYGQLTLNFNEDLTQLGTNEQIARVMKLFGIRYFQGDFVTDEMTEIRQYVEKAKKDIQSETQKALESIKQSITKINKEVDSIKKVVNMDDLTPDQEEELFGKYQTWEDDGLELKKGDVVNYNGTLYDVIQSHTTQPGWEPPKAPSLFKKHTNDKLDDGTEIISDWKQPQGAHDAYHKGDKVRYLGVIYQSKVDNNVYAPDTRPQDWELVVTDDD
ncbi:MAG: hypothetical protein Q4A55_06575 [Aerococcus sp.]|nr:hypothetical protein [Aerococcus sp.]